MNILVCVKEVPDLGPDTEIKIDDSTGWIKEDDSSRYMMNRFDEFVVEEAIRIKEIIPNSTVDALTVGHERSQAVVRRAMGMGADHGIHILDESKGYPDPFYIADLICKVASQKEYDLILAGVMAEDTQQGLTGPILAETLNIPFSTSVVQAEIHDDIPTIQVEKEMEGGKREVWKLRLPCLLTIQSGINQPRYPALSKVLKAKKAELENFRADELKPSPARQSVQKLSFPNKQRTGRFLEGTPQDKARELVDLLMEKSFFK